MVLPTLFVGIQAIRTNALEGGTLEALGQRLAHSRTYADVEDAMFNQTQVVWRYLSGDAAAKKEFPLTEQVVDYWLDRWAAGLPPDALKFADGVRAIEGDIRAVAARVFKLYDSGQREAAYLTARHELVERLQPALAVVNREIYRQARELSVQRAVAEVQTIVEAQRRVLWSIILLALVVGLVASWLISGSLARPIRELRQAMAVVGAGDLDHAIEPRSRQTPGNQPRSDEAHDQREQDDRPQDAPLRLHDRLHLRDGSLHAQLTGLAVDFAVHHRQGRLQALHQLVPRGEVGRLALSGIVQLEHASGDGADVAFDGADAVCELQCVGGKARRPAIEPVVHHLLGERELLLGRGIAAEVAPDHLGLVEHGVFHVRVRPRMGQALT